MAPGPSSPRGFGPGLSTAPHLGHVKRAEKVTKPHDAAGLVLEAWSEGYMVGSLIIMAAITVANMRKGVLLHKLILLELILGTFHGTFIFTNPPVYGWYLSTTAILLNTSWSLHNVIAWMKTKPFLTKKWSYFYIGTVILAQPYWVVEIYANFTYFNNINDLFVTTRPYEALFRDPWWIFTTINLFYNIVTHYRIPLLTIIVISPRFGVLLTAMCLSIAFIIVDICSVTDAFQNILPDGLNPFWKMAFVFKCLTDSIILDDFKTALDRLMRYKMQRERFGSAAGAFGATAYTTDAALAGDASYSNGNDLDKTVGFATTSSSSRGRDPLGDDAMEAENEARKIGAHTALTSGAAPSGGAGGGLVNRPGLTTGGGAMSQHIENYEDIDLPTFLAQDSAFGETAKANDKV